MINGTYASGINIMTRGIIIHQLWEGRNRERNKIVMDD